MTSDGWSGRLRATVRKVRRRRPVQGWGIRSTTHGERTVDSAGPGGRCPATARTDGGGHRDAGAYFEDIDDEFDDIEDEYLRDGEFLVGETGGRIVAPIAYREPGEVIRSFIGVSEETTQLKQFNVDPEYQRRGYGSRIYTELEVRALDSEYGEIALHTTARQIAARRFYEERGYKLVERTGIEEFAEPFELLVYRKRL